MAEKTDPFEKTRMTLGEHLDELRSRLIKGILAVGIAFIVAWYYKDLITEIVTVPFKEAMAMLHAYWVEEANAILEADPGRPRTDFFDSADPEDFRLRGFNDRLNAIGVGESFFFQLKICVYFSLFVGAPVLLWQMWQFVAAGLYKKERGAALKYFPISVIMFVVGVLFGYYFMVPYGMYFLNRDAPLELAIPQITMENYLTFLRSLCLAFGVIFQLPLLMTFLGGAGMIPPALMSKYRGHFIVGAFVIAAIITPPDPITQLMMGVPLIILYEVGIMGARIAARRTGATDLVPVGQGEDVG